MTPLEKSERESRLWHILEACTAIIEITQDRTLDDYVEDRILRWAVERQLTNLGEAMSRLSKIDPSILSNVSAVPEIIAFRNFLVHDYPNVDAQEVWRVIQNELPVLLKQVRALLPAP